MKKIAFAIEKGGTGKTTSAVHLAYALADMGRNVLLVDTDTQDQCAAHLGLKQFQPGLGELILGELTPRQALSRARDRLYLLPPGDKLALVKARLADIARERGIDPSHVLARALSFTESGKLDYIILDTAPGSDALLINVVLYADTVIVPVPPEMLAVRGMVRFYRTLRGLEREPDYILPTIHDLRVTKTRRILFKLQERFADKVLDKISYTSHISEAAGAGLTLFEYRPKHPAARELRQLAKRIDEA
jgi:chromosome partitioning protein